MVQTVRLWRPIGRSLSEVRGRGSHFGPRDHANSRIKCIRYCCPTRLDLIEDMRSGASEDLTRLAADLDCADIQVVVEIGTRQHFCLPRVTPQNFSCLVHAVAVASPPYSLVQSVPK